MSLNFSEYKYMKTFLQTTMCKYLHLYSKTKYLSIAVCVVGVASLCFSIYFLSYSPSPWMSHHGPFYMAYSNDHWSCKTIHRSATPLPLTALVSFPGSGNTWLRHLVQQATGIATGSVYNDSSIRYRGFPAEGITDNSVILIKTHRWGEDERSKYQRAVILIRDPFNSLLSEFNRQRAGHMGHAKEKDFLNYWHKFVYDIAVLWPRLYRDWLNFEGALHVILYENLKYNTRFEMEKLLRFLDINVEESDLDCMIKNQDGRFRRRTSKFVKTPSRFTYHMKTSIKAYKQEIEDKLNVILQENS